MEARPSPWRLFAFAAALIALGALTSSCGGGAEAQAAAKKKDPPLAKYSDQYVSFSYPAAWKASQPTGPGELHFHPLVYLSTQPVGTPCHAHGTVTTCGWPIKRLQPGGVLAVWQPVETPITSPVKLAGTPIRVGGRPAGRLETTRGECRRIGADRTIEVMTEVSHQSLILFTACLRGPGLAQAEKSVDALLASTEFASQ